MGRHVEGGAPEPGRPFRRRTEKNTSKPPTRVQDILGWQLKLLWENANAMDYELNMAMEMSESADASSLLLTVAIIVLR